MRVLISALVLAGLLLGLTASSSALTPSVPEQNKAIVRGATDAMNARQYSVLSDYFALDMIDHDPYSGQAPGLAGFVQGLVIKYSAFPDWVNINDEMIAEGDQVATRWTGRGTQTGLLMGLPSSGTKVKLIGMRWYRLAGGKIVETWVMFGLLHQIELIPMLFGQ
jgi:predicted ester cyclase